MKKILKWGFMLNKRLYKKASFIIILALIPLCVFMFSSVAQKEKGFMHIILVQPNPKDTVAEEIITELTETPSVVRFSLSTSAEDATYAVKTGEADEAWIFPENTEQSIDNFVKYGTDKFISVISREKTVFSMLSREKLSSAIFKYTARAFYLDFARTEVEGLDNLSDKELMEYYENVSIDEELFVYGNPEDSNTSKETGVVNYLTTPIRGFLGILIMICGMAAALYLMNDEQKGTFSWAPDKSKLPIGFASIFIAVLNITAVAVISLLVSNLSAPIGRELLVSMLYCICCTVFCMFLKLLLSSIKLYAVLIPLISIIAMAVCPVFYNLNNPIKALLPPTYYVNAIYSADAILNMAVYTFICFALCMVLVLLKKIRLKYIK